MQCLYLNKSWIRNNICMGLAHMLGQSGDPQTRQCTQILLDACSSLKGDNICVPPGVTHTPPPELPRLFKSLRKLLVFPYLHNVFARTCMPTLLLQWLQLQGLLHGCAQALNQMHKPAKLGLHRACSLSTCQQPQLEPDSRPLTCPTTKGGLEGASSSHQPAPRRQGGSRPVCFLERAKGNQISGLLPAKAEPEGKSMECLSSQTEPSDNTPGNNSTAIGVQQSAILTEESFQLPHGAQSPMQLAQNGGSQYYALGRSSKEAEKGSNLNYGQVGFRLGIHQRPAEPLREAAAVKRRCIPNWGKSSQAQISSTVCAGHQAKETELHLS